MVIEARKPMEFRAEELLLQSGITAGIGMAVGGPPGAVAGAVSGFVSYVLGYFAGESAKGLFDLDDRQAEIVRRFVEIAIPAKTVGSMTELGRAIFNTVSKAPAPLKTGLKYGTFGLATGYVVEPYVLKDGDASATELVGLAGLSAAALRGAQFLAPLGVWGAYSARQITSILSDGKYGAGVFLTEPGWRPETLKKVFGKEIELPKIRYEEGKLEVKAKDYYWEGLFYSKEQVAQLMQDLQDVSSVLEKYGIKVGTKESQRLGEALFDPVEQANLSLVVKQALKENGLTDLEIEEIADALRRLQKTSLVIADRLAQHGGAGRHYLSLLGSERRLFQHVFGTRPKEMEQQTEILRTIRDRGSEAKMVLPSAATLRRRGLTRKAKSKTMIDALWASTGRRKPKEGDRVFVDGRWWTYTRLKEGGRPVWWSEYSKKEFKEKGVFFDLTASLYRQISEDLSLIRQLTFFDWLGDVGAATGRISDRPQPGWVKLQETGQSAVIRGWGALTGKYVSPDLYRTLRTYVEVHKYRPPSRKLAAINFRWKAAFLSLNFKSYVNAFLGNMVLSFANGHDPHVLIYEYLNGIKAQDSLYEEAKRHGLLRATIRWERVIAQEAGELEKLLKPQGSGNPVMTSVKKSVDAFARFTDYTAEKWYGKVDEIFRFGLYRKLRREGLGEEEAARIALQTYAYYGDLPVIVKNIRDTIMPFVSYQVRIFPQIMKSFLKYPERYAITLAFVEGIQRSAYKEMYGDNWEEGRNYEDLVRPAYMEERIGGFLADFIRIPSLDFGDGEVMPSGYMYTGFIPWNIPISLPHLQITAEGTNLGSYLATLLIQNPIIRFVSGLFMNTDPATGRQIYNMAGIDKALPSVFQYAAQTFLPIANLKYPLNLFAREGYFDPVVAWFNYYGTYPNGEPVGTAHMIWNTVAPSVLQFDPNFNLEMSLRKLEALERAYMRDYTKAVRRAAPTPVLEDNFEKLVRSLDKIWEQKAAIMEAYFKATGGN